MEPGLAPLQSHPDPLSLRGCRGAEGGTETGSEAQKQGHRDTERDKERPTCVDTGAETGHESDGKAEEDTQLKFRTVGECVQDHVANVCRSQEVTSN